ncbi:MAG TPA: carboxypeptidase regulatory-like domain-containing protein, partial [Acidobacteriaceae bacterium]|nr:carboxypeptidase regulatory-like domain-containing protein [Acidobacteriaceae bacterium]
MRTRSRRLVFWLMGFLLWAAPAFASALKGQVTFNGLPVPGATVVVTQGGTTYATITDAQGNYTFPNLSDGDWTVHIAMTGFAAVTQTVAVGATAPAAAIALKMLPPGAVQARAESLSPPIPAAPV